MQSTFKNYKHFIIHPTSKEVDEINEFTFQHYAKKWAYLHSFFPVVRIIEEEKLSIKIYYHKNHIHGRREMEDFCATYYREVFPELRYKWCNVLKIPIESEKDIFKKAIINSNSMKELEGIYINSLTDDSYVSCNEKEGGLNIGMLGVPWKFKDWNKLINEGYLAPEYEEKCKMEILDEMLGIENIKNKQISNDDNNITCKVQVFTKTGGGQPSTLDADQINKFFKGNYAKQWAMIKGYISTFKSYKNGIIYFDLITDPRCKNEPFFLSKFIASEYRNKVSVLKDATSFEVSQFEAKDIIGFLLAESEFDKLHAYNERMKNSYDNLSDKPDLIHVGRIS